MKKLLMIMLCFALCLSVLVGCKKEDEEVPKTDAEIYSEARTTATAFFAGDAPESFGMDMSMAMEVTQGMYSMKVTANGIMRMYGDNTYEKTETVDVDESTVTVLKNDSGYTLYHNSVDYENMGNNWKVKVEMTPAQYEEYNSSSSDSDDSGDDDNIFFKASDFTDVTYSNTDAGLKVTCKGLATSDSAEYRFFDELVEAEGTINKDTFEYIAVVKDGKIQSVTVKLEYKMITVTSIIDASSDISFDLHYSVDPISEPSNIASYESVTFEQYKNLLNR